MAIPSGAGKAAVDAVESARSHPLVQRVINDDQLHEDVRQAVDSAKALFEQLQSNASAGVKLTNDKLYDELQQLAVSLRDAGTALSDPKAAQKSGLGVGRVVGLGVAGGIAALALSENLRGKALDALFGAEEEFQYTPSSAVNGASAAAAPPKAAPAAPKAAPAKPKAAAKPKAEKPKADADEKPADDAE